MLKDDAASLFTPAEPCSHPSLMREHKVLLNLITTILRRRGVSEQFARQEAEGLLRPTPPGKEVSSPAKPKALAG